MKCPRCRQRAVSFYEWGYAWRKHVCDRCGLKLRAGGRTWAMALFCLVLLRLSWWTAGYFSRAEGFWHGEDRVLIFLIHGLPLTIALIFLEYYTGSYWPDE